MSIKIFMLTLALLATMHISCTKNNTNSVKNSIKLSRNNQHELEKVLNWYRIHSKDSLKFKASIFLIENMFLHYSVDTSNLSTVTPIYNQYAEISGSDNWARSEMWAKRVDSLESKEGFSLSSLATNNIIKDIESINSDWLIKHIDQSFKAWKNNIYTKNLSFELFCEYILPYRFKNGVVIDNSREYFYNKYKAFFTGEYGNFINAMDSALFQMKDIKNNIFHGNRLSQVYDYKTIEKIRFIQCYDKCWYNAASLTAAGMAIAIDFVPSWGNRGNGHTWNTLIFNDEIWPFEPFWDEDRWKYREIYNNKINDSIWGKLQLPKVFRKTFSINHQMLFPETEDVPPIFQTPLIKDVSHQYFDTSNVFIQLPDSIKKHPKHAYIYVFNSSNWTPVHWGEIEGREVVFSGMGRDIIYIAGLYKHNSFTPICKPFHLDTAGNINYIEGNRKTQEMVINNFGTFPNSSYRNKIINPINNAIFISKSTSDKSFDTLHTISRRADISGNYTPINPPVMTKLIKLKLPSDTVSFAEISFFKKEDEAILPIHSFSLKTPVSSLDTIDNPEMMFDELSSTGFYGKCNIVSSQELIFEFDSLFLIGALNYIPYSRDNIINGYIYTLYYWDNQWKMAEAINVKNENVLIFKNIPAGFLYRIDSNLPPYLKRTERIFTYENGKQIWW